MSAGRTGPSLAGVRLVIASHNAGKVREIGELLAPYSVSVVSAAALDLPEPEETGSSFTENALLKAHAAAEASGLVALADDSGLAVPALDGDPGIYSARWAGPEKDFSLAMEKVWSGLDARAVPAAERTAYFVCVLALAWPDGAAESYEGRVDGRLVWPPRGNRGFGYDPMFLPTPEATGDRSELTFGEMDPEAKHAISHRADAFRKLVRARFA